MWAGLLFAIGLTAVGLHLWRLAWRYLQLRRTMRGWPRVPAQVLGYRTEVGPSSRRVEVQVRYQYNGQTRQVWCGSPTRSAYGRGDLQASRQVAAKFPRGTSQQVFVNPTAPEEVFLELPEPHMLAMLAAGGTILVALAFKLVTPRVFGIDPEIVTLAFMLVLAAALAVVAVFAAIALWRTPRPRSRERPVVRRRARAMRPRRRARPWRHWRANLRLERSGDQNGGVCTTIERMRRRRYLGLFAVAITLIAAHRGSGSASMQTVPSDPERILTERFQFSEEDVRQARSGQPVAKMIAGRGGDELAVVGALRLDGDKKRLVDWVRNIEHFRHAAELGLTRGIESPPAQSFADLVLDAKDLAALQSCRPGRCDLRVPDELIAKFQSGVAWGTPEAPAKANALFASMLTEYAAAYQHGGDAAVGSDFGDLLRSATTLYELAPEFAAYLQKFPASKLAGVDQRLYWTNLTDEWGSIVSLHHLVVYRRPSGDTIIADKTFYASRYFDVAVLVLSMHETRDGKGYYLIAGSRAKSSRLTGVGGRVLRGQVERAAASTVEMYLVWLRDSLAAR